MKEPRPFLPLLKQMLGIYRWGPVPLLLWFIGCGIVLYFSAIFFPLEWMSGHDGSAFAEAQFPTAIVLWFFLMLVSTPLPFQMLAGPTSLEFLFSRALDRALWLRAERLAVIILAAGPLVINLALSPWEPILAFDPAPPGSPAGEIQARYMSAFPGSQLAAVETGHAEQLVIRHGTEMFAAWLVWSSLALIFLVAGYFAWSFTAWQRAGWHHSKSKWRPWLGGAMTGAPIFSVIFVFLVCLVWRVNLYEESFLFFARHPAPLALALAALIFVVQPLSERNIRKLEFEFL
jgi:hypothetical protein